MKNSYAKKNNNNNNDSLKIEIGNKNMDHLLPNAELAFIARLQS